MLGYGFNFAVSAAYAVVKGFDETSIEYGYSHNDH